MCLVYMFSLKLSSHSKWHWQFLCTQVVVSLLKELSADNYTKPLSF